MAVAATERGLPGVITYKGMKEKASDLLRHLYLPIVTVTSLLLALFICVNARPFQMGDSASYYYQGLQVARGLLPFVDIVDNKNPGLFYILSLPASVWNWDMSGAVWLLRVIDILNVVLILILLTFVTSSKYVRALALLAGIVAYASLYPFGTETIYTETLELFFISFALLSVLQQRSLFLCGISLGIALLIRQTALLDCAVFLLVTVIGSRRDPKGVFRQVCLLVGGILVPLLLIVSIAWSESWLAFWWQYAFSWNMRYAQSELSLLARAFGSLKAVHENIFLASLFDSALLGLLVLSFALPVRSGSGSKESPMVFRSVNQGLLIVLLFVVGFAKAISPSVGHFHHYLSLVVTATLLCACLLHRVFCEEMPPVSPWRALQIPLLVIYLTLGGLLCWMYYEHIGEPRPRDVVFEVAEWAHSHTTPQDTVLAWGYKPELYLLAQRNAGSRFFHNLVLTNNGESFLPIDDRMRRLFEEDIVKNAPKYIFIFSTVNIGSYSKSVRTNYSEQLLVTSNESVRYYTRKTE